VLYRHAAISEVAVIGMPDPKWIEAVTAVIVLREGHTLEMREVLEHCAGHLSGFKIPKKVVFTQNLPRNASGKILKRELRLSLL
jgi:fatty-acyl-CoA synthase